ncbi:MAG: SDR family oxidoreductase [Candidatus Omnitrophica bacterium]|nr:SDR family oxidoreductase [Candidatus Omnitrophota bacterium]MDD5611043.1 SDR family oxidoreductase [Candidatus Omnitrophota bacterium]
MPKKTVLITGGAGFIGSHLCDNLIARDFKVICMDNLITGTRDNIRHLLKDKNFRFVQHDIARPIKLKGKIDHVLHFASPASPQDYLRFPIETLKVGSLGTHNALGLSKEKKAKFLVASTSEIYGDPLEHPQKETYWGNVNSVGIRSCYDEAKRFSEALTMAYHRSHKLDTRIVRIFNTYGPRMRINDGRVVPNFIYQALTGKPITVYGKGSQTRSFCYVSDLVEGIYKLMLSSEHGPVNLGNPDEFTILEFAKMVTCFTRTSSKIVYKPLPQDDPRQRRPDISKAKRILKWSPKISLKDGLQKTIEWFKINHSRLE